MKRVVEKVRRKMMIKKKKGKRRRMKRKMMEEKKKRKKLMRGRLKIGMPKMKMMKEVVVKVGIDQPGGNFQIFGLDLYIYFLSYYQ